MSEEFRHHGHYKRGTHPKTGEYTSGWKSDNSSDIDINIPPEEIEPFRRYLKKLGFEPIEIDEIVLKSEAAAKSQDIRMKNFQTVRRMLEVKLGGPLSSEDLTNLMSIMP